MKAMVNTRYGPPSVLELKELPVPIVKADELLIRVYASTVNRTDSGFLRAKPFVVRFFSGLRRPNYTSLGNEFAGVVESVGERVTQFKIGERVFGFSDRYFGGHSEYMAISEKAALATIPDGMSYETAAALTEGGHYALTDIRAAKIKAGQHVMVYGATGGIGSAAVQIIKAIGAHVTAVCATPYVDLVKSLGADKVVDYQTEDFTATKERYDVIFDAVGKSSFGQCKPLLKKQGIYVSTELGPRNENPFRALSPFRKGKRVIFPIPVMNKEVINYLKNLAIKGQYRPLIDRYYSLAQIPEAYEYVESGQKIGNVVIRVREENEVGLQRDQ